VPAIITALNIYPVKSCRGIALQQAQILSDGFAQDRRWLLTNEQGRFLTQREVPRLALIGTAMNAGVLTLTSAHGFEIRIGIENRGERRDVLVWNDPCSVFDCGDEVAAFLSDCLEQPVRLGEFDSATVRLSNPEFTGDVAAATRLTDGYPFMLIGEESLEELNTRLPTALPMNRFRPNIVIRGLPPYAEDEVREFTTADICLRVVKPCIRCIITCTDQTSAEVHGIEPIRTLRAYRWNAALRGVAFGQNLVLVRGAERNLKVGDVLQVGWRE
jgi:uncharacterized protein